VENEKDTVLALVHILFREGSVLYRKIFIKELSEKRPDVNWNEVIDELIYDKKIKEVSWAIDHTILPGQIIPYEAQITVRE
jgi:hypothetical protein